MGRGLLEQLLRARALAGRERPFELREQRLRGLVASGDTAGQPDMGLHVVLLDAAPLHIAGGEARLRHRQTLLRSAPVPERGFGLILVHAAAGRVVATSFPDSSDTVIEIVSATSPIAEI